MSLIWVAMLAGVIGREGRPSSLPTVPPRPAVVEASATRQPGSTPRLVPRRPASHRHFGSGSDVADDDILDEDIFDEEDGEEPWMIGLDLPFLDPEAWLVRDRPPSDGDPGCLPSPHPDSRSSLHL